MRTRSFLAALGVALTLSTPAALATWYAEGSVEPDTSFDAAGDYMFTTPDQDPNPAVKKLYFNAIPDSPTLGGGIGPNPNLAATGSRSAGGGTMSFSAYLGVWKDCNRDGYIGAAYTALMVYRAELLPTTGVCAPGSVHNHGGWVHEFRWIASYDTDPSDDTPVSIIDDEAQV